MHFDLPTPSCRQFGNTWFLCGLLFVTSLDGLAGQSDRGLEQLNSFVGTWESRLDPKYADHPMVRQFNPQLKRQEMILEWGAGNKMVKVRIFNLDRPNDGDRTLIIEGLVVVHPSTSAIMMFEYNAESEALFEGEYSVRPNGDLERTYTLHFANGRSDRYREVWSWKTANRDQFDWITERVVGTDFVAGDVIVEWHRR